MVNHFDIIPVIELNDRASKLDSRSELFFFDKNGIPHSSACGRSFRNWGIMKKSFRRFRLSAIPALYARLRVIGVNILLSMKTPDSLLLFYAVLNCGNAFINAELLLKGSGTG